MTLLLIRHGETALNVARVLQPAETPLSARGLRQARALAARLAAGPPVVAAIVSSDLPRALQTAACIAAATGAPVETSPLWQERNFGDWRGRPHGSFDVDPLRSTDAPPGGESLDAFGERVGRAFAWALERHAKQVRSPDEALAVVTHGLVIGRLVQQHLHLPAGVDLPAHFGNTGLTIVDAAAPYVLRLVGCTRHLDGAADDDPEALVGG